MLSVKKVADGEPESSLVERIRQGDPSAEDELVQKYKQPVLLMAKARIRFFHPEAAEDIVHDTFVAVIEALRKGKLREPEKLPRFICGVERNIINDFFRDPDNWRKSEIEEDTLWVDASEGLEVEDQCRRLPQAFRSLSKRDQLILFGSVCEGRSDAEIAAMLKISPGCVRQRKSRALKRLRKEFDKNERRRKQPDAR